MRFYTGKSDHLTHVKAFNEWQAQSEQGRGADRQFCEENFLSRNVLREISELRVQVSMGRRADRSPQDLGLVMMQNMWLTLSDI